jgi:hypothetical protein
VVLLVVLAVADAFNNGYNARPTPVTVMVGPTQGGTLSLGDLLIGIISITGIVYLIQYLLQQ